MARHQEPEKYPTRDRAEQRMRDDAAKGQQRNDNQDDAGKHAAPPADSK